MIHYDRRLKIRVTPSHSGYIVKSPLGILSHVPISVDPCEIIHQKYTIHDIHLISDDRPQLDDWYIDDSDNVRKCVIDDKDYWDRRPEYKKIIATSKIIPIGPVYGSTMVGGILVDCNDYYPRIRKDDVLHLLDIMNTGKLESVEVKATKVMVNGKYNYTHQIEGDYIVIKRN